MFGKSTGTIAKRSTRQKMVWALIVLWAALLARETSAQAEAEWTAGWERLTKLGEGFVVWESNRTGDWRIWRRELDGSGLRMISPDEKGRDHFSPHLSPDGQRLVFLSYPKGYDTYDKLPKPDVLVPMLLMNVEGGDCRPVAPNARSYGEDRAVVWVDHETLIYIAGDRSTRELNVRTGEEIQHLPPIPPEKARMSWPSDRWLINATKTFASTGTPSFSVYHDGALEQRNTLNGCQPYFSRDGVWGFWMGGGGGPINRIHLATRETGPIIEKNDARMPADRGYLYFPMVSSNQRLFAFGSSPMQHDHFNSDYDIFVCEMDPQAFQLIGKPVRYSFDKGCDRFPDVFLADRALGRHDGEGPFRVAFASSELTGEWEWDFGDGSTARGGALSHTYDQAGDYEVTARQGDRTLRGSVTVRVAEPPRLTQTLMASDRQVHIVFSEPVHLDDVDVSMEVAPGVASWRAGADDRSLIVVLKDKLSEKQSIHIKGVKDRAQQPNVMAATQATLAPATWPSRQEGLVFLWENGAKANTVLVDGAPVSDPLTARGAARLDRHYAMILKDGAYIAPTAAERLLAACQKTNQLSIEAVLRPDHSDQHGPARIISFSTDASSRNFTVGQENDQLFLRLRTPATGPNGANPEVGLCMIPPRQASHLLVTYQPGRLVCYLNGQKTREINAIQGDFRNWSSQQLLFGDEASGERDWAGTLEGIAIYNRALDATEAAANAGMALARIQVRPPEPRLVVEARLKARSEIPTLEAIRPYRQALVVYEYTVEKVVEGPLEDTVIRVAHWALLDGQKQPAVDWKTGARRRLALERFERNPQIETVFISDTLELDIDLNLFYEVPLEADEKPGDVK